MFQKLPGSSGKVAAYRVSGKLTDDDYKKFIPQMESLIEREGKVRFLCSFEDFKGWTFKAMWDDFIFGMKHRNDFERFALVGDKDNGGQWMAKFAKPFIGGEVKFFYHDQINEAWQWLRKGTPQEQMNVQ